MRGNNNIFYCHGDGEHGALSEYMIDASGLLAVKGRSIFDVINFSKLLTVLINKIYTKFFSCRSQNYS